jgi:hypothetical protein
MNEIATAPDPWAKFFDRAPRIASAIVALVALIWWAAGIERRAALLEQSVIATGNTDRALADRIETVLGRNIEKMQRIEDRLNRHLEDDQERFARLTAAIKPCK